MEDSAELEINRTKKLKPDLKSALNPKSAPDCRIKSIDDEHYLKDFIHLKVDTHLAQLAMAMAFISVSALWHFSSF